MERNTLCCFVLFLFVGCAGVVQAQLVAVDDTFAVPVAQDLVVEARGVLDNDTYNGEPAAEAGATVELVAGPLTGTLECGSNPGLELCPDGSFFFTPGAGYTGSDSFTYRAMVGIETALATATLSACQGGPSVFVCWKHAEYLAKLDQLGPAAFFEGFEERDGKIGQARYVFVDDFTLGTVLSEIFSDGFESGDASFWSSQTP